MRLHKFGSVDAFVALDLDGAEVGSGPVRWARRILQGGAKDLARSQTYTYAALGMRRSGCSAGISAEAPDRAQAVTGFVAEAAALVASGSYLPDAAKGVSEADLAPLRAADPRTISRLGDFGSDCEALSAAVAAESVLSLDGATVLIEGFADRCAAMAQAVSARGARVVGVSTPQGSLVKRGGVDADALQEAWTEHGGGALAALASNSGTDLAKPAELWSAAADVVFAASKMGIVHHGVAGSLDCKALVPAGRLAFTSRALAVCRRRGIVAVPDFVSLAGSTVAAWSDPAKTDAETRSEIESTVAALMAEALKPDDGPFLGACYEAESFLLTWQDELPFGRPLAA